VQKEESSAVMQIGRMIREPIPGPSGYPFGMDTQQKTFRLRVEADAATAALEAALAIIRRGGVRLLGLRMEPGVHGMNVDLNVGAEAEEMLVLCRMRLCNVIGIVKIRETPRASH
jgi:acetolactate synthase regulatory subunit